MIAHGGAGIPVASLLSFISLLLLAFTFSIILLLGSFSLRFGDYLLPCSPLHLSQDSAFSLAWVEEGEGYGTLRSRNAAGVRGFFAHAFRAFLSSVFYRSSENNGP